MSTKIPNMKKTLTLFEGEKNEAGESLKHIEEMSLESQGDLQFAKDITVEVKTKIKAIDEMRRKIVDPLNQVVKDVNAMAKPAADSLKKSETILKDKMASYSNDKELERDRLLKAAGESGDKAEAEALLEAAEECIVEKVDGMSMRPNWTGEITDEKRLITWCLGTGRHDLLMPNEKVLKALTKAKGGDPQIDGWKAFPKTVVAVSSPK